MAADFGTAITDFGGAISDLFGAAGSAKAGEAYGKEADIANQNALLAKTSGDIQVAQQQRALTLATGTESAQTAGAGFTNSGSAIDLMRSSVQQGALAKALISNQTAITVAGYQEQAEAAKGQQEGAEMEAKGKAGGGILGAIGGVASLFGL